MSQMVNEEEEKPCLDTKGRLWHCTNQIQIEGLANSARLNQDFSWGFLKVIGTGDISTTAAGNIDTKPQVKHRRETRRRARTSPKFLDISRTRDLYIFTINFVTQYNKSSCLVAGKGRKALNKVCSCFVSFAQGFYRCYMHSLLGPLIQLYN